MRPILREPYRTRPVPFLDLLEREGWRLKVYGAAYGRDAPRPELVDATKKLVTTLPQPADADGRYAVGFMCVHDGRGGCYALAAWWADENELHRTLQKSPAGDPAALEPVGPDALSACVWDIAIMAFERQAWLDHVLANDAGPDLDAYLRARLDADL